MLRTVLLATLVTMLPPATGAAEIHKWTDAQGRVHFGDKPRDGAPTEKVEVRDYKPGTDASVLQVYERSERLNDATRAVDPLRRKQEAAQAADRKAACDEARDRLRRISGRVNFVDEDGKTVPTTERERVQKQREVETWIDANCR